MPAPLPRSPQSRLLTAARRAAATWLLRLHCIGLCGLSCTLVLEGGAAAAAAAGHDAAAPAQMLPLQGGKPARGLPASWVGLKHRLQAQVLHNDLARSPPPHLPPS